jgi:DNA ligase-1
MTKQFKPMLSATYEEGMQLNFPLLASQKLDGVRCVIKDGVALSRKLLPFRNKHLQKLLGGTQFEGMDGEIIVGDPFAPDCFRRTQSFTSSIEGVEDFVFYVFDKINMPSAPFEVRLRDVEDEANFVVNRVAHQKLDHIASVDHMWITNQDELEEYEAHILSKGGEGVMLRDPTGPYKFGRSTLKEGYLMKVKRFHDSEAVITGFEEQMHNTNEAQVSELGLTKRSHEKAGMVAAGTLGAFVVNDKGTEFSIGTGLTAELRQEIWDNQQAYLGKLVKYKYFPSGGKEKPRHPVFLGFRDENDG